MGWYLELRDRSGVKLGELLNARSRTLRFVLRRMPTLACTIDASHPFARTVVDDDRYMIAAYNDITGSDVLRFQGPIVGHTKTRGRQTGTIALNAAGLEWRLSRRTIGRNVAGATFGTNALSTVDRGELMGRVIDALNSGEATNIFTQSGDTGIRRGTITTSSPTYVDRWIYRQADQALAELGTGLDAPDWEIEPVEPTADGVGVQLGRLNVAASFGAVKPEVAFEFGTGKSNVEEWTDVGDAASNMNHGTILPPGYPENGSELPLTSVDAGSIALRGLYEDTVPDSGLTSADLRQQLIAEHVRIRKIPRRRLSFNPVTEDPDAPLAERRVPRYLLDYVLGDVVRFRAVESFPIIDTTGGIVDWEESLTVDALMRVFAVEITLDDASGIPTERVTLEEE